VRVVVRVPRRRATASASGGIRLARLASGCRAGGRPTISWRRSLARRHRTALEIGVGVPTDANFKENVCASCGPTRLGHAQLQRHGDLREPAFLSPRHTASFAVFAERRSEFKAYTRQAVGANVAVTFNARRDVPVTVGYGYSVGRTTADPWCTASGSSFVTSPTRCSSRTGDRSQRSRSRACALG